MVSKTEKKKSECSIVGRGRSSEEIQEGKTQLSLPAAKFRIIRILVPSLPVFSGGSQDQGGEGRRAGQTDRSSEEEE